MSVSKKTWGLFGALLVIGILFLLIIQNAKAANIGEVAAPAVTGVIDNTTATTTEVAETATGVVSETTGAATGAVGAVTDTTGSVTGTVGGTVEKAPDKVTGTVGGTVNAGADTVNKVTGTVTGAVKDNVSTGNKQIDGTVDNTITTTDTAKAKAVARAKAATKAALSLQMKPNDAAGAITSDVNGVLNVDLCGVVTDVNRATNTSIANIKIDGATLLLNSNAGLLQDANAAVGQAVCLTAKAATNPAGYVVIEEGDIEIDTSIPLLVSTCGFIKEFAQANLNAPGILNISNETFFLPANTSIDGAAILGVGSQACVMGQGAVQGNGATSLRDATATFDIDAKLDVITCGALGAVAQATENANGYIIIGGLPLFITSTSDIEGLEDAKIGSDLCLTAKAVRDASGAVSLKEGAVEAQTTGDLIIESCGVLTAIQGATADTPASIVINSVRHTINTQAQIIGLEHAKIGADYCLDGQATDGTSAVADLAAGTLQAQNNATSVINICGALGAIEEATASTPGRAVVNGVTYLIDAKTSDSLNQNATINGALCLTGDGATSITGVTSLADGTVKADVIAAAKTEICGKLVAFEDATATTPGEIIVDEVTYVIDSKTNVALDQDVAVGDQVCLKEPNTPEAPVDPDEPINPDEPSDPTNPGNPGNPGNPADPINPGDGANPGTPTTPDNPNVPAETDTSQNGSDGQNNNDNPDVIITANDNPAPATAEVQNDKPDGALPYTGLSLLTVILLAITACLIGLWLHLTGRLAAWRNR